MFVDYIENECERLLQESPQFTELQREDHELLDEYPFLNMITDSNGVTKVLDLNMGLVFHLMKPYHEYEYVLELPVHQKLS